MNARQRRRAERLIRQYLARGGACVCLDCAALSIYVDNDYRCTLCGGPIAIVLMESAFRRGAP